MIDLVQSFSHIICHLITSDSDDGEDITIRKHSFIGQVNNTICYFSKLSSFVKYNLYFMHTVLVIMDVSVTHELVGSLVCLFSCCLGILYFVYDLIINKYIARVQIT